MKLFLLSLGATVLIAVGAAAADTQNSGVLRGTVSYEDHMPYICISDPCDPPNRSYPVAGMTIRAEATDLRTSNKRKNSKRSYQTVSGKDGSYRLRLPSGRYLVTVDFLSRKVRVKARENRRVDFKLLVY